MLFTYWFWGAYRACNAYLMRQKYLFLCLIQESEVSFPSCQRKIPSKHPNLLLPFKLISLQDLRHELLRVAFTLQHSSVSSPRQRLFLGMSSEKSVKNGDSKFPLCIQCLQHCSWMKTRKNDTKASEKLLMALTLLLHSNLTLLRTTKTC